MLHELASATGKRIVFYCAFGERSAMAVQAAQDAGIASACHIQAASTPGEGQRPGGVLLKHDPKSGYRFSKKDHARTRGRAG